MSLFSRNKTIIALLCAAAACFVGCQDNVPESKPFAPATRDVVATSCYPTTWMAEQLLADVVPIECLLPTNADPMRWQPATDAIEKLQSARLIVINGAGFEKWVGFVTLSSARVVDTSAGLAEPFFRYEDAVVHQHGPGGEQSLEGVDGRTWLDPIIAKHQASRIADAAIAAWPEHQALVSERLVELHKQLDAIDKRFSDISSRLEGVRLLSSAPVYNYIARRYGWKVHNLGIESARPLTAGELASLTTGEPGQKVLMLWNSQPGSEAVSQLTQLSVASVVFLSGELPPQQGDYVTLMNQNIDRLQDALSQERQNDLP